MKKKIIIGILSLTLAFSMIACGGFKESGTKEISGTEQQKNEKVVAERGTFEGSVYTNKSMGIQATFPEGCTMYSDEEIQQLVGAKTDVKEDVDKAMSGTIYDVIAVTADQNASIQVEIEDTEKSAGKALSAKAYGEVLAANLKDTYSNAGIEAGEVEVNETTLDGMEFAVVSVSVNGMSQKYGIHQVENYVIVFSMTYINSAQNTVQQFLDSIKAI